MPETIHAAFAKTGVWPFNPDMVTKDMMAPSLVTSSIGHLPISQPSPVKVLATIISSFLISNTPVTSRDQLPAFIQTPFTPTCKRKHKAYKCEDYYKGALYGMQSTAVLQEMYCKTLSSQLAAQEEKKMKMQKWLERNEGWRQEYKEELRQWEEERAKAKLERRCTTYTKSKLRKLKVTLPKPTLVQFDNKEADESDEDTEEEH
ncbi:hypothetical protein BDR07DRAFT_1377102 [Suillus spraguei]|nr:hypothetical protein BDR07DRAFT_1377102 [Suillus spraguei]